MTNSRAPPPAAEGDGGMGGRPAAAWTWPPASRRAAALARASSSLHKGQLPRALWRALGRPGHRPLVQSPPLPAAAAAPAPMDATGLPRPARPLPGLPAPPPPPRTPLPPQGLRQLPQGGRWRDGAAPSARGSSTASRGLREGRCPRPSARPAGEGPAGPADPGSGLGSWGGGWRSVSRAGVACSPHSSAVPQA